MVEDAATILVTFHVKFHNFVIVKDLQRTCAPKVLRGVHWLLIASLLEAQGLSQLISSPPHCCVIVCAQPCV